MKSNLPGTARELVESLIISRDYTVKQIAGMLGVTCKTIYRIRKGLCPQPKTHINLIQLYLSLHNETLEHEPSFQANMTIGFSRDHQE